MFNGGTRKRLFSESSSSASAMSTPSSTTSCTTPTPLPKPSKPKSAGGSSSSKSESKKHQQHAAPFFRGAKPDFLPLAPPPAPPPPPPASLGYFPPFETCLDTFAAAAAALNPRGSGAEVEKSLKLGGASNNSGSGGSSGGNGGESSSGGGGNSLGISDYGLWPHPAPSAVAAAAAAAAAASTPAGAAFPFPYSFFWPSKRPPPTFAPFHTSLLGNWLMQWPGFLNYNGGRVL